MMLVEPRWDEARAALAAAVMPLSPTTHPVAECDGLVLAEDLVARIALPSFDTSAMDGWAVTGPGPWTIVGESLAGHPSALALAPGQGAAIATGAVVPAGAEAVIRSEDGSVERSGADVVLRAPRPEGPTHIRRAGEECASGELLATAGSVLTPGLLGLAAAAGHDDLHVIPRPRVVLVLLGDELATEGIPGPGRVRDSLGQQVPAWLARMGAHVVSVQRAQDRLAAHVTAIQLAAAGADLVLTTGGTAAGPVDHLHHAIEQCGGEVVIDSVAVRPGHPMLAAHVPSALWSATHAVPAPGEPASSGITEDAPGTWLVGLPGNPQSAVVTLMSLAAPIIAGLAGRPPLPELATVRAAEAIGAPAHEDRLVLGTSSDGVFTPGSHLGSGMLRGLAGATGFGVLPPGGVTAGATVRWLPLPLA